MKIFIGGSKMISDIDENIKKRLNEFMRCNHEIIIGDCWGIDAAAQKYLYENNYPDVIIYASGNMVRNNIGNFKVSDIPADGKKGFEFYRQKDIAMTNDADCGFMIWDGKSKGTLNNIIDLMERKKSVDVYLTYNSTFYTLSANGFLKNDTIKELGGVIYDAYVDVMDALK